MTTYRQDADYISRNLPNVMLALADFYWWPTGVPTTFQPKVHVRGCPSHRVKDEWFDARRRVKPARAHSLPAGWAICLRCATKVLIDVNEGEAAVSA